MLILCYATALDYWRLSALEEAERRSNRAIRPDSMQISKVQKCWISPPKKAPDLAALDSMSAETFVSPLDIMIGDRGARLSSHRIKQHLFTENTPQGSFVYSEEGYAVSSPEFCLFQMASQLSLIRLIELAFELCGDYSLPARKNKESSAAVLSKGFVDRPALTNKRKLATFASRMQGVNGRRKIERALRYVVEGSRSPMETKLVMLLTLPFQLGGYNFSMPILNKRILPTYNVKAAVDKQYYSCDLFWPDYDLAVEYDSNMFHSGPEHIANDSKRRNSLISLGVTPFTFTSRQIYSLSGFDKEARKIASHMGRRLQIRNPGFYKARQELRNELLWR